jgi:nitroimidazol reductase NimA-like FMN-containing flavoprotein (pyridoxamine 5'-phosphate oxidase superfamily)
VVWFADDDRAPSRAAAAWSGAGQRGVDGECEMATMTEEERDRFLEEPRYGILNTLRSDGSPIGVPVWFDWNGETLRMFSSVLSPKIKRLQADPRASVLVVNHLSEEEAWVAFDGPIAIREEGGFELAERLAPRYWDLSDPERRSTLELWRKAAAAIRLLELEPTRIRSYKD